MQGGGGTRGMVVVGWSISSRVPWYGSGPLSFLVLTCFPGFTGVLRKIPHFDEFPRFSGKYHILMNFRGFPGPVGSSRGPVGSSRAL